MIPLILCLRVGRIISFSQHERHYPVPDSEPRAYDLIRKLSLEDFPDCGLKFFDDGTFGPVR